MTQAWVVVEWYIEDNGPVAVFASAEEAEAYVRASTPKLDTPHKWLAIVGPIPVGLAAMTAA